MADEPDEPTSKRRKPRSHYYKANNDGGFSNPPVKNQFKKGGRPGPGRPRGSKTLEGALRKMLRGKISRRDGPAVPMTEAMAVAARNVILTGGARGIEFGLRLNNRYGAQHANPDTSEPPKADFSGFNELEKHLLISFFARATGDPPEANDPPENAGPFYRPFSPLGQCTVSLRKDGHLTLEKNEPELSMVLLPDFNCPGSSVP